MAELASADAPPADETNPPAVTAAAAATEPLAGESATDAKEGGPEEGESTAVFKPLVNLAEIDVVSGEENEDILMCMRGKLFRYTETMLDKGSGKKQWIERGVGEIKLLKNKESQEQRFLMRQEKTMKLIVNCPIDPRIRMTKNDSSDKAWVWTCYDFSDGVELVEEIFCFRAPSVEDAAKFKEQFDAAQEEMKKLLDGADAAPDAAADDAADALSALSTKEEVDK